MGKGSSAPNLKLTINKPVQLEGESPQGLLSLGEGKVPLEQSNGINISKTRTFAICNT